VISVGLIDKDKILEEYRDDTMTVIPTTCDRETKSAGKSLVQFHDFVCMNFPSYRDNLDSIDEEQKLVCLISFCRFLFYIDRIGGVMVSVLDSSAVDRGF
jgi:hypothetical protein